MNNLVRVGKSIGKIMEQLFETRLVGTQKFQSVSLRIGELTECGFHMPENGGGPLYTCCRGNQADAHGKDRMRKLRIDLFDNLRIKFYGLIILLFWAAEKRVPKTTRNGTEPSRLETNLNAAAAEGYVIVSSQTVGRTGGVGAELQEPVTIVILKRPKK